MNNFTGKVWETLRKNGSCFFVKKCFLRKKIFLREKISIRSVAVVRELQSMFINNFTAAQRRQFQAANRPPFAHPPRLGGSGRVGGILV